MSWKTLVKSVAPVLGTALGGPLGGMAVKAIGSALLGDEAEQLDEKSIEKRIASVIEHDTDALLKIKQADQQFEARMRELDIDLERINAADRDSARDLQKTNKTLIVPVLATITVACFFGVVFWVLTGRVTLESTLLGFVLGQVSSKAEQVYNFFFGSSAGSKQKTDALAQAQRPE